MLSSSGHDANLPLRHSAWQQFHQQSIVASQIVAASEKIGERVL